MPLGPGVRYRMRKMKGGGHERLAFRGGRVIETKNMETGAVHSPSEFLAERPPKASTKAYRERRLRRA